MSQVPYTRQYAFGDELVEGSDREVKTQYSNVPHGTHLDTEFNALKTTLDNIQYNAGLIQRTDGLLANKSVHLDALAESTLDFFSGTGLNFRGPWVTATLYAAKDVISNGGPTYVCLVGHTSGTFATDLAANKWMLFTGNTTLALLRDGSVNPTADLPLAGFKLTGVGDAAARDQYISMGQRQDAKGVGNGTVGGTGDAITLTLSPAITAYTLGMMLSFKAATANTGAATLNVNGVGATAIRKYDQQALVANDIKTNSTVTVRYDGTFWNMIPAMGQAASAIAFSPTGAVAATDVQAAIAEVDSEKLAKTGGTMTGNILMTAGGVIQASGCPVQSVITLYSTVLTTGTTAIPWDGTIPQVTEGNAVSGLDTTITAKFSTSSFLVEVVLNIAGTSSGQSIVACALFKDGAANALATAVFNTYSGTTHQQLHLKFLVAAADTAAHTFSIRAGSDIATAVVINARGGVVGTHFGNTLNSSMRVTEIAA